MQESGSTGHTRASWKKPDAEQMFCSQAEARRMALGYLRAVTVVLKSKTNVGSHVEEEQVKTAWFHSRKEATDGVRGEREQYRDGVLRQAVDKIQNQQAPDSKDVRGGINPTVITKTHIVNYQKKFLNGKDTHLTEI